MAREVPAHSVVVQAPLLNRGTLYFDTDKDKLKKTNEEKPANAPSLRPGEKFSFNTDGHSAIDLATIYFAGDYAGDQFIVVYLEE